MHITKGILLSFVPPVPLWRQILRTNFTSWKELADFLQLDAAQSECILKKSAFPLNLPRRIASKIKKGTLEDPLLKQFLPTQNENEDREGFYADPVADVSFKKTPKLLQKYRGRALLVCTSACAMHCRYCFRQNFDYEISNKLFEDEIVYIAQDASLHEVILSGGDPLSLSDHQLNDLIDSLEAIPHVKLLRFHTRFPIGIPERIDTSFISILKNRRLQTYFIIHSNHALELDDEVLQALKALQREQIILLNQSVLLKGVNDSLETLKELCLKLVQNGILPYYLHQLDKVQGAAHFEVPENQGKILIDSLAKELPGYALPKYVKEIPGQASKIAVF